MCYQYTDKIIEAYCYATLAFLILRIFHLKARSGTSGFLNISNGIVSISIAINLIYVILDMVKCGTYIQSESVSGNLQYTEEYCNTHLGWTFCLGFMFQTLFMFKKFRTNIGLTAISVGLLIIFRNVEWITIFFTSLYKDMLPSSWSIYYRRTRGIWIIVNAVIYFIVCFAAGRLTSKDKT